MNIHSITRLLTDTPLITAFLLARSLWAAETLTWMSTVAQSRALYSEPGSGVAGAIDAPGVIEPWCMGLGVAWYPTEPWSKLPGLWTEKTKMHPFWRCIDRCLTMYWLYRGKTLDPPSNRNDPPTCCSQRWWGRMTLVGRIRRSGRLWREWNRKVRIIQVAHVIEVTGARRCVGISRVPGTCSSGRHVTGFVVGSHATVMRSATSVVYRRLRAVHGGTRSRVHGGLAGERSSVVATCGCWAGIPGI